MINLPLIIPSEDFWSRRVNTPTEVFEFAPLGLLAKISANWSDVLAAAHLSAGRFSRAAEAATERVITIQIIVRPGPAGPVPADLPERLVYSGVGKWITLSAGQLGYGFANLETGEAVILLSSTLAAETRLVSRYFIDHYLLNFILTDWAMLHASCVLAPGGERLIVMVAPHDTGKSTTALHLLRAGYTFLADGMALWRRHGPGLIVGGYPIGEVKLRDDVLALFPEYGGQSIRVREHHKTVANLRETHPDGLVETLIKPASIQLCFVERNEAAQTRVTDLSRAEALPLLATNTVFWDEASSLKHNSQALQALLRVAKLYRLQIGTSITDIVGVIDTLA
jgi:hypothetical protein